MADIKEENKEKKNKKDYSFKWLIVALILLVLLIWVLSLNINVNINLIAGLIVEFILICILTYSFNQRKKEEQRYTPCFDIGFDYNNEVDVYINIGYPDKKKRNDATERIQLITYSDWKKYILGKKCNWNDDFIKFLNKKHRDAKLYLDVVKTVLMPTEICIIGAVCSSKMDWFLIVILCAATSAVAMSLVIIELQKKDGEKHFLEDLIGILSEEVGKKEKELSASIDRIKEYERIMDCARFLMTLKDASVSTDLKALICKLDYYYQSPEWKIDYGYDEVGLLPSDLKRGVLSEDGIYNLLEEYKDL